MAAPRGARRFRFLAALWAVIVVAFVAFLAFGVLRVGAGNWFGRRMSFRAIWTQFLDFLTDQGATQEQVLAVTAALAVALVGAACLLWLAFTLEDAPPNGETDGPADL